MSFGFSVSDIYVYARLAYKHYVDFNSATETCQEFRRDLLLFHQVLIQTGSAIDPETSHLSRSDRYALRLCLDSCKELLWVRILGGQKVPEDLEKVELDTGYLGYPLSELFDHKYSTSANFDYLRIWRTRFRKRKLASRIPKLQCSIS